MKDIPGLDGYYATEEGEVVSIRSGRPYTLKARLNDGYPVVTLRVDVPGKGKQRYRLAVHRLVTLAFHGEAPRPGLEIRHLNGVRTDSRPVNLRWGTRRENIEDAIAHGTLGPGMRARHRKLNEQQVRTIIERHRAGECKHRLALEFGVHPEYVPMLACGERWSHLRG